MTVRGCSDQGGRCNVKRCVFNFFRRKNVFQEASYSTSAVQQPRTMNGFNLFLTAVQDVMT